MTPAIIDVGSMGWTAIEDPSRVLLVNANFESGGNPPAGWTQLNGIGTTVAGSRPGGSGTQVGRLSYDGVNATGYLYELPVIIGATFKATAWTRGYGGGTPYVGFDSYMAAITGVSGAWQYGESSPFTAVITGYYAWCQNLSAGAYVDFDDLGLIPFVSRTPNLGSAGGRLDMGDGLTPATLPTRTPNTTAGFSFNGSQYLQWMSPLVLGTYTYCALVMRTGAATAYLLDARAGGGGGRMYWDGANLQASTGTLYVDDVATNVLPYGQVCLVSATGIALSAPSKIVLGATNALATPWVGNVLQQQLYPGTLTPMQLRDVKNRLLSRCWK
jgi:hypothetical protein